MAYWKKYIFNPIYKLKNDKDRILLMNKRNFGSNTILHFLHPVHAILLCMFNGDQNLETKIKTIADFYEISINEAISLIKPIIENNNEIYFKYLGVTFTFPPKTLIENTENIIRTDLNIQEYIITDKLDFRRRRLSSPINMLICINLRCYTDCIYCYANKNVQYKPLSTQKWIDIIHEAKNIGIETLDITGGEFFMQPGWYDISSTILECGYTPEISTKVPLSEHTLRQIKDVGLKKLQYSLDTLDCDIAITNYKVKKDYIKNFIQSIRMADKLGLSIIIKSTLDRNTCNQRNVANIINFAITLSNIERCVFSVTGYSCYKSTNNYSLIKPSLDMIYEVVEYIKCRSKYVEFPLYDDTYFYSKKDLQNYSSFIKRAQCTANIDGLVVLPDGKITICEELYWNNNFIIGNINNNSLIEIWNSPKATNLWNLQSKDFPVSSPCKTCLGFNECRHGKGVCWKMVIAAYGHNNVLYPDPRCPKAPKIINNFTID